MIITQKELKNGNEVHFDNIQWCKDNHSDDIRCGWITYNERFNTFAIFFNGACIHSSKTFSSAKKRLEKLMSDWNCEYTNDTI